MYHADKMSAKVARIMPIAQKKVIKIYKKSSER
jgi:hypothetical protein